MRSRKVSVWLCWIAAAFSVSVAPVLAAPQAEEAPGPSRDHGSVRRPFGLGILVGYGMAQPGSSNFRGDINPYGIGAGLQGWYEWDSHWVLGAGGELFLGGEDRKERDGRGALIRPAPYARYALAHALVGYNFRLFSDKLVARPTLWLGAAIGQVRADTMYPKGLVPSVFVAPGGSFVYLVGDRGWFIGEDLQVSLPIGPKREVRNAILVLLATGKRF